MTPNRICYRDNLGCSEELLLAEKLRRPFGPDAGVVAPMLDISQPNVVKECGRFHHLALGATLALGDNKRRTTDTINMFKVVGEL